MLYWSDLAAHTLSTTSSDSKAQLCMSQYSFTIQSDCVLKGELPSPTAGLCNPANNLSCGMTKSRRHSKASRHVVSQATWILFCSLHVAAHSWCCSATANRQGNTIDCSAAGYEDAFNPFGWDGPTATHPMQNQYSSTQFNRNPAMQQDRQQSVHLSVQPRHAFNLEPRHRDLGSGDLASAMSLPNSSGTEGRAGAAGGVSRGPNKRKGGRSKKAPPNDSNAIQRCLEVMEQLLEEEDAEPFAEPVSSSQTVAYVAFTVASLQPRTPLIVEASARDVCACPCALVHQSEVWFQMDVFMRHYPPPFQADSS